MSAWICTACCEGCAAATWDEKSGRLACQTLRDELSRFAPVLDDKVFVDPEGVCDCFESRDNAPTLIPADDYYGVTAGYDYPASMGR